MQTKPGRSWWVYVGTLVAAVGIYYLLPDDMGEPARRAVAIFIVAAVFWATEALPLYATSLCVIGLEILFLASKGGLAGKLPLFLPARAPMPEDAGYSYELFLEPFASGIIILFMGGFLLSSAVSKHGLDRAISARLLRPFSAGPRRMVFGVMLITAFFSMWMSNTATTVMMLAIIRPLLSDLPPGDKYHRAVVLAVPFGANIGGIGTPIGTPPNAVAMAALVQAGVDIRFLDWMLMAVPLAVLLIIVAGLLLLWFFPPQPGLKVPRIEKPKEKISLQGRMTLVILVVTIVLWLTGQWHGLASAAVALLAAAALTAMGVLDRRDVDSIDWNVLILMWGGLSLGLAMETTGLLQYAVAHLPTQHLAGFGLAAVVVLLAVALSTFMSNTATAIVLVPMIMAMPSGNPVELAILTALACSFAMAMPVSTPPNAIAFATGKVPASALVRSGLLVTIACIIVLLVGYQYMLPLFLDLNVPLRI